MAVVLLPAYKYLNPSLYASPTFSVSNQIRLKNSLQDLERAFCSAVINHFRLKSTFAFQTDAHL